MPNPPARHAKTASMGASLVPIMDKEKVCCGLYQTIRMSFTALEFVIEAMKKNLS
jgi:hypothetical protein